MKGELNEREPWLYSFIAPCFSKVPQTLNESWVLTSLSKFCVVCRVALSRALGFYWHGKRMSTLPKQVNNSKHYIVFKDGAYDHKCFSKHYTCKSSKIIKTFQISYHVQIDKVQKGK